MACDTPLFARPAATANAPPSSGFFVPRLPVRSSRVMRSEAWNRWDGDRRWRVACSRTQCPLQPNGLCPAWLRVVASFGFTRTECSMDPEVFNASLRKFLKTVGVSSQREIEQAVATMIQAAAIAGTETFPATMTLDVPGLKLRVTFAEDVKLQ